MTDEITLIIPGNPITKKNHSKIIWNKRTKKPMVLPSTSYTKYAAACGWEIKSALRGEQPQISEPVNVKCVYYMATARRVDLTNLIAATHDILVEYGVLADDNSKVIISVDGSRVYIDRKRPRVEVTITKAEREQYEIL